VQDSNGEENLAITTCWEDQFFDTFADFWMEFLQLGFYLMLSW
jgi:hypothetical protein